MALKYHYEFSGGMCWECTSHRAVAAAQSNGDDFEMLTISFWRNEIDDDLQKFINMQCRLIGINFLSEPPRLSPWFGFGALISKIMGYSDEEIAFMRAADSNPRKYWNEGIWAVWQPNSIALSKKSKKIDLSVHAPSRLCDAFMAALYDFNHGLIR